MMKTLSKGLVFNCSLCCHRGEYISLELFYFVNLTSTWSLIPYTRNVLWCQVHSSHIHTVLWKATMEYRTVCKNVDLYCFENVSFSTQISSILCSWKRLLKWDWRHTKMRPVQMRPVQMRPMFLWKWRPTDWLRKRSSLQEKTSFCCCFYRES